MALHIGIDGTEVTIKVNSAKVSATIDQRNTAEFVVIDANGTSHYQPGQQVTIVDDTLGTAFAGFIDNDDEKNLYPNATIEHTVQCIGNHYHADKRHYHGPEFNNRVAGDIITDFIEKVLSEESVTANYARDHASTQADFLGGTLNNTVASLNQGGQLQLAPAGASVTVNSNFATDGTLTGCSVINGSLAPTPTNAIKIVGTQSVPGNGNSYTYWKVWAGSAPTINGQYLHYDIWIDPSSPQAMIGVDIVFTDGTTLRDANSGNDAQNLSPHPKTDLSGVAVGQWYHRRFGLSNLNGKTISYISVAIEGDNSGTYTGWIKNIQMADFYQLSIYANFFNGTLNTAQQMQTNGYSNTSVTVIPSYALAQYNPQIVGPQIPNSFLTNNVEADYAIINSPNWYASYSVDAAKILSTSYLSWQSSDPTNTQTVISYWLDGWGPIQAAENAALPNFPPGLNLAGRTLSLCVQFFALKGAIPEVAPSLSVLQCSIYSAYAATKQDASLVVSNWQGWGNGTFVNTIAHPIIDLPQPQPFKNIGAGSSLAGFDLFSSDGAATQTATSNGLQLANSTNTDIRSRMTYAGQFMNGVIYAQITVGATMAGGVVYRCSNWGPNNNSYAYSVTLTTTQLLFGRGSNSSGAGAFTSLATLSQSLTAGTVHTLVVQFIGSAHLIYVDGTTPALVAIDSTYMGPGYCGFRGYNSGATAQNVTFNGFAVNSGNALALNGAIRNWDDTSTASQSTYNASPTANNRAYEFQCPATSEARVRMDWAGVYADFTMEFDVLLDTVGPGLGCVYRTTNWQTADSTWAYGVEMTTTSIKLNRAPNSGTTPGTTPTIASATLSLSSGNWHHLKVVAVGSSHKIYVDDVLMINATDSTFTSAGWVGLRNRNTLASAYNAQFDNFGIVSALSGTWTSSSLSLAGAGTYGTSVITWRDQSSNPSVCTNTVQTSINGGTTWTNVSNGGAIPGLTAGQSLAGVSLLVRANLSTTTASALPGIDNLNVQVLGAYNATGTRISAPLALSPVGRVGSASMSWLGSLPNTNTNIVVDTSPDGSTWTNVGSGASGSGSVSGSYHGQPDPIIDSFTSITIAQYQNTTLPGGTVASWSYDTTNSRLLVSGGTNALYLYNQQSIKDGYVMFDTDQADGIGLVIHYNAGQMYYLVVNDGSATVNPNTVKLYKYTTVSTLLQSATISLARGTASRFKVEYSQGTLTVWEEDTQLFTYTDTSSPIATGICGFYSAGGSQTGGHFYQLFIQGYGDVVSSSSNLYHRVTLSTTDPTVSPVVSDLSLSVRDPSIADGALIPSTQYSVLNSDQPIAAHLDDLATQSDHTWTINDLNQFIFQPRTGKPAPWIASGRNMLASSVKVSNIQQEYRNVQWMSGGSDVKTFTQSFTGDGHNTTFNLQYPVDSILSITLDNVPVSVGPKGTSGNSYYFEQGSTALAQDGSIPALTNADQLIVKYNGRVPITVKIQHQRAITARKGKEKKTSGKVEHKLAMPAVATKQQTIKKAKQVVEYYTKDGRILEFTTLRPGLAPGMLLTVVLPQHGFSDDQMLVESIDITWEVVTQNGVGVHTPFFDVKCTEGAVIGDWTRLFSHIHGKR